MAPTDTTADFLAQLDGWFSTAQGQISPYQTLDLHRIRQEVSRSVRQADAVCDLGAFSTVLDALEPDALAGLDRIVSQGMLRSTRIRWPALLSARVGMHAPDGAHAAGDADPPAQALCAALGKTIEDWVCRVLHKPGLQDLMADVDGLADTVRQRLMSGARELSFGVRDARLMLPMHDLFKALRADPALSGRMCGVTFLWTDGPSGALHPLAPMAARIELEALLQSWIQHCAYDHPGFAEATRIIRQSQATTPSSVADLRDMPLGMVRPLLRLRNSLQLWGGAEFLPGFGIAWPWTLGRAAPERAREPGFRGQR